MKASDAMATLASIRPEADGIKSELEQRQHTAHLRISGIGDPARWAEVYTPGDVWFSLEVEGGFGRDHLEGEDTTDDDVRRILAGLVDLAVHYVLSEAMPVKPRILGFPSITLTTPGGNAT
jgi:transglutaminase-like putative cysteine protease